jgi:prepilin-type processing-associated H-X9-DG protein
MDDSLPFEDFPASRHMRGYNLSFADGHVERWPLLNTNTVLTFQVQVRAGSSDWTRLKRATTTPLPGYVSGIPQ